MALRFEYGAMSIQALVNHYERKQLNLEPGFQRRSVWSLSDRKKLIESVWQNCPLPSIFLYRQTTKAGFRYEVIDGKQRIESILGFFRANGFRGAKFKVELPLQGAEPRLCDGRYLAKRLEGARLQAYPLQTITIDGDLNEIIDLFVRINSTGKRLTSAEKRHAKFYNSQFLKLAGKLAERKGAFFLDYGVLTKGQISRMKHVELVSELLASLDAGDLINKKDAIDSAIRGDKISTARLKNCAAQFSHTLNRVLRVFPNFWETRFANSADFYSLFMFVYALEKSGAVLTQNSRNAEAQDLLLKLSNGVDTLRDRQRKAQGAQPGEELFAEYLMTVQGDTDSVSSRRRRQAVLQKLFGGLFEQKDEKRLFTKEQRRLFWNSETEQKCGHCGEKLSWRNFTVDHVKPHSKGGRTSLKNAALLCRSCNSSKGNRRKAA